MFNKIYNNIEFYSDIDIFNKNGVIYLFEFENGKFYVGQTIRKLYQRLSRHTDTKNKSVVKSAMIKYKKVKVTVLEENLTQELLNIFEPFYIRLFNSKINNDGYNITDGGNQSKPTLGMKLPKSQETKDKISASHLGKSKSDIHKKHMSEYNKGRISTFKGKHHTEESKKSNAEKHYKQYISTPDNIIFIGMINICDYYKISIRQFCRYVKSGMIHKKSGQFFSVI